jgi:hypothetical protein
VTSPRTTCAGKTSSVLIGEGVRAARLPSRDGLYPHGSRVRDHTEQCPLCLRADRPMTREHVFAHWLVRRVRGGRLMASSAPRAGTPSTTALVRIGGVTAAVCAECNAGWMSTLEDSFRRAVFARPRVGTLQGADRITMSRWFTKTAFLLAHARGGALVDEAAGPQLIAGMPDEVEVFLARRRRPPQRLDFMFYAGTARVAILVDDLVGHVAARGTLASRHGTQLWPLRSHLLRWETLPVITALMSD